MDKKIKCSQCDETFTSGREYRPHFVEKHLKKYLRDMTDYIEVAEKLYRHINPKSKKDVPNSVYIKTHEWYKEWMDEDTELGLFEWILKNK